MVLCNYFRYGQSGTNKQSLFTLIIDVSNYAYILICYSSLLWIWMPGRRWCVQPRISTAVRYLNGEATDSTTLPMHGLSNKSDHTNEGLFHLFLCIFYMGMIYLGEGTLNLILMKSYKDLLKNIPVCPFRYSIIITMCNVTIVD